MDPFLDTCKHIALGRFTVPDAIRQLQCSMPTHGLAVVTRTILDNWKAEAGGNGAIGSAMHQTYHPPPEFFFGKSKTFTETYGWLKKKVGITAQLADPSNPADFALSVLLLQRELTELIGVVGITGYVKTGSKIPPKLHRSKKLGKGHRLSHIRIQPPKPRVTAIAKFSLFGNSIANTRKSLPKWKRLYFGDYQRALRFVSKFVGRVHTWFSAWMQSHAMILSKVGLLHYVMKTHNGELRSLPHTMMFLALAASEFGKRKEFTLESQKQGGLNEHLIHLLDIVKSIEPSGIKFVAFMIPAKELWLHTPHEHLSEIHVMWYKWMQLVAVSLQEQWTKGVRKCAMRKMRVLPGAHMQSCGKCTTCLASQDRYRCCPNIKRVNGSGVNSVLWNMCADAYQNGSRNLRGIEVHLGLPLKCYGKVMQLVANDQFWMAKYEGKEMDPNLVIFCKITQQGILPWRSVHPFTASSFDSSRALSAILNACSEANAENPLTTKPISPLSWIGIPQLRRTEVSVHRDTICGCAIPPMTLDTYDWVRCVLQPYGATSWTGK